jgi:hypothetical protein
MKLSLANEDVVKAVIDIAMELPIASEKPSFADSTKQTIHYCRIALTALKAQLNLAARRGEDHQQAFAKKMLRSLFTAEENFHSIAVGDAELMKSITAEQHKDLAQLKAAFDFLGERPGLLADMVCLVHRMFKKYNAGLFSPISFESFAIKVTTEEIGAEYKGSSSSEACQAYRGSYVVKTADSSSSTKAAPSLA